MRCFSKLFFSMTVVFFLIGAFVVYAGGAKGEGENVYKIAFVNQYLGDSFCVTVQDGFERAAKDYPYFKMIYADCENGPEKGLQIIDNLINQEVDMVFMLSWLGNEETITKKMNAADIPIMFLDIDGGEGSYFWGFNNRQCGEKSGEMLVEWANEHWPNQKYDIVLGVELIAGEETYKRTDGARDSMVELLGEQNVVSITELDTDTDQELALKMFSEYLTAHPDSSQILVSTINDEAAIGYWKASQQQNRLEEVAIVGIGCDDAGIKTMLAKDSNYIGAVATFPENDGIHCLKLAHDLLLEGKTIERYNYGENAKVTLENLKDYYPKYIE